MIITIVHKDKEVEHDSLLERYVSHGLAAYIEKHGWHFTHELMTWAVAQFELEKPIVNEALNVKLTDDELFTANMAKSDFYPSILRNDAACIAYAKAITNDKDGYEGMPFKRWLTDCEERRIGINWELFI